MPPLADFLGLLLPPDAEATGFAGFLILDFFSVWVLVGSKAFGLRFEVSDPFGAPGFGLADMVVTPFNPEFPDG